MRNIEIKARVSNVGEILQKARELSGSEPTVIHQHDTFYNCHTGRLKLRRFLNERSEQNKEHLFLNGSGQLIFYNRPDCEGPKLSSFEMVEFSTPKQLSGLHGVLSKALGAKNDVKKTRHLFLVGQTRVHIDEVQNLGNFMELEVCLHADQSEQEGGKIAYNLMAKLGVSEEDLISGAYEDLLVKAET